MVEYMKIERKKEDHWEEAHMWDLKNGEIFRMFFPETDEPFIGDDGLVEWKVKGDPYTQSINGEDIWTVVIDEEN